MWSLTVYYLCLVRMCVWCVIPMLTAVNTQDWQHVRYTQFFHYWVERALVIHVHNNILSPPFWVGIKQVLLCWEINLFVLARARLREWMRETSNLPVRGEICGVGLFPLHARIILWGEGLTHHSPFCCWGQLPPIRSTLSRQGSVHSGSALWDLYIVGIAGREKSHGYISKYCT